MAKFDGLGLDHSGLVYAISNLASYSAFFAPFGTIFRLAKLPGD
jgi:hypothetical protein